MSPGARATWFAAIASAALFFVLASPNLTAQGPYYDELHQATGCFAYVGQEVQMFARARFLGLPVLNVTYEGALKTALYGSYLRLSGAPFTLWSWRALGIAFVSLSLLAFVMLTFRRLRLFGTVVFVALFLTDGTVLLATRHDWGPVALALCLRLLFLGVWLAGDARAVVPPWSTFLLGLILGIATFEKLSSVVLVVPLCLLLLARTERRTLRHWMLALAGGLTGAAPLIAVNVASLARDGGLISLESFAAPGPWTKPSFPTFVLDYVNLARGAEVQSLILGQSISQSTFGKALPGLLLLCLAAVNVGLRKRSSAFARSNLLLGCYFAVGCALYLLPNFTWAHHWIVGTPFQYLAIALSAEALWRMATPTTWAARVIRPAFFLTLLCWMLAQGAGLWTIEAALLRGDASQLWHPSFGELGRFAGERRGRAFFIVASWGLGSQIASLGQGEQGLVDELFWDYRGPEDVANLAEAHRGRDLYVVARSFAIPSLSPEIEEPRERILADMATLGGWVEEPVEPEMARLSGITVRKFAPRRS